MKEKRKNSLIPEDCTPSDFPRIDLKFEESKEQAWIKVQSHLDSKKATPKRFLPKSFYVISVAASLALVIGMITFFRYYTKTAYCPAGKHLTVMLPDHSEVILNAESIISWHPFWMKFDRKVQFEGEAYFQIKKGSGFTATSSIGETKVLGTTFNIYSREKDYKVSCFTGSVHIASNSSKASIVLHPGEQGTIHENGTLQLHQLSKPEENKAWIDNMFVFTGAPLNFVIREIERQYNISINLKEDYPLTYTGNFSRSLSAEEVLNLICSSLELKFEPKSKTEYLIYKIN
jgi:ferric-dicitrate binding protein FerR (iron transport regulator)